MFPRLTLLILLSIFYVGCSGKQKQETTEKPDKIPIATCPETCPPDAIRCECADSAKMTIFWEDNFQTVYTYDEKKHRLTVQEIGEDEVQCFEYTTPCAPPYEDCETQWCSF